MTTFYTALWNMPGYLPDGSGDLPPVFKSYSEAADYLADELEIIASSYDKGDHYGDTFDAMAAECAESTEEEGFAMDGPDGYRYAVEETTARGRWTTGEEQTYDAGRESYVVLSFTERSDGLGPTAKETADDVGSVCGSHIEAPNHDNFAYVMVDSWRLAEAAEELRDSGFELVGADGELVE